MTTRRPDSATFPAADGPLVATLATLLGGRRRLVVATSGGPDSQALLHWSVAAARAHGWQHLGAVGVDHGLRPEAAAELAFARQSCAALGVGFVASRLGPLGKGNVLQQARLHRRRALLRQARRLGAEAVLLGHTATDQAETLLQHLARGAGLEGAGGMRPSQGRDVLLVRPWLTVTRSQVLAYVRHHAVAYACDPSNDDLARTRTVLRQQVLPVLERLYPGAVDRLAAFADAARQEDAWLAAAARRAQRRCLQTDGSLMVEALQKLDPVLLRRVLRVWLRAGGAAPGRAWVAKLVGQLTQRPPAAVRFRLALPGALVEAAAGRLVMGPMPQRNSRAAFGTAAAGAARPPTGQKHNGAVPLTPGQVVSWGRFRIAVTEQTLRPGACRAHLFDRSGLSVAFAADSPHVGLSLRSWCEGDRLAAFGLGGAVTVGNLFTNAKVPRQLRADWPVVVLGDEVAWVVGLRRGCQAPVDGATGKIWVLRAERIDP